MEFTQSGVPLSFEVTFDDSSLYVGLAVIDDSAGSPVLLSVIPMTSVYGNTYRAKFTPTAGKNYIFNKAVYTDDTYTEIDDNFSQGSESIYAEDIAGIVWNALVEDYEEEGSFGVVVANSGISSGLVNTNLTVTSTNVLVTVSPEVNVNLEVNSC